MKVLLPIFNDAAAPQKAVFILLVAALAAALADIAAGLCGRSAAPSWRRTLGELRCIAPLLGLLTASLNGLHMAQTIQRLPSVPTLKDLAPGISEVSALLSLGALVGLCAAVACLFPNDPVADGERARLRVR